jgi:NitT/TauT family transport system substrate-binding protein
VLMKGSNGASVGLYFKMLLREVGIDPKSVNYIQDLDSAMLSELFVGGMGDYLIVDNLSARTLVARYPEHVAIAHETVVRSGDVPWSVYYRETRGIDEDVLDKQRRFCIALAQGMQWVLDHDAEEFRDELADIFPKSPIETVVQLTNVFRKNRMWTSPVVDRQGYERWQTGIADGYLVEKPLAYETIVDNRPALRACPGK